MTFKEGAAKDIFIMTNCQGIHTADHLTPCTIVIYFRYKPSNYRAKQSQLVV